QSLKKLLDLAGTGDAVDAVETRRCRSSYIQVAVDSKRQMVRGDARFQRRKNEDLTIGSDLENRAAAIPHIQELLGIERNSGRDPHSFGVNRDGAVGRSTVDIAFKTAGNVEVPFGVKGHTSGIHHLSNE